MFFSKIVYVLAIVLLPPQLHAAMRIDEKTSDQMLLRKYILYKNNPVAVSIYGNPGFMSPRELYPDSVNPDGRLSKDACRRPMISRGKEADLQFAFLRFCSSMIDHGDLVIMAQRKNLERLVTQAEREIDVDYYRELHQLNEGYRDAIDTIMAFNLVDAEAIALRLRGGAIHGDLRALEADARPKKAEIRRKLQAVLARVDSFREEIYRVGADAGIARADLDELVP